MLEKNAIKFSNLLFTGLCDVLIFKDYAVCVFFGLCDVLACMDFAVLRLIIQEIAKCSTYFILQGYFYSYLLLNCGLV